MLTPEVASSHQTRCSHPLSAVLDPVWAGRPLVDGDNGSTSVIRQAVLQGPRRFISLRGWNRRAEAGRTPASDPQQFRPRFLQIRRQVARQVSLMLKWLPGWFRDQWRRYLAGCSLDDLKQAANMVIWGGVMLFSEEHGCRPDNLAQDCSNSSNDLTPSNRLFWPRPRALFRF